MSLARSLRTYSTKALYLNPHAWKGLPADQIFELHNMRKAHLGEHYNPNDEERFAILATIKELLRKPAPTLDYVYEIENFRERFLTEKQNEKRTPEPKKTSIVVTNEGAKPHEARRIENLTRIAAYEMPLLAKYRQQYAPKPLTETPLKLTYQSDFTNDTTNSHNRVVVLTVNIKHLGLGEKEAHKFRVLCGNKLNLNTDVFRLKSDNFPEASQNARHLVDTFNKLLTEAKDLKDDFSDIPVDTRHMRNDIKKPVAKFPEEWKRPQDAPIKRHEVVNRLVERVREWKDGEYMKERTP